MGFFEPCRIIVENRFLISYIGIELQNPLVNIDASARYLSALLNQAKKKGKISNYVSPTGGSSSEWGEFDFSVLNGGNDWFQIDKGQKSKTEKMINLTAFFGAAHNSDSVVGPFLPGIGIQQGRNAEVAMRDLINMKLIQKYGLDK